MVGHVALGQALSSASGSYVQLELRLAPRGNTSRNGRDFPTVRRRTVFLSDCEGA